PGQPLVRDHQPMEISNQRGETAAETFVLRLLSFEQRDLLAVLTHADEVVAEIRLEALLVEIQLHERLANQVRDQRAEQRIKERGPDEVSGNAAEKRRL